MSDEPRPRSPRAGVVAAAVLAAATVVGAALVWVPRSVAVAPLLEPRFGAGTRPRLEALRDRLAAGLVSLAQEDGGFAGRSGFTRDPWARRESTALAVAGLSAAKRRGSRAAGLEPALAAAKRLLLTPPKAPVGGPGIGPPSRSSRVVGLAATVLGFALGGNPADMPRLDRGAVEIAREADLGPLPESWPRALATRAVLAVIEAGRGAALGADPMRAVQVKGARPQTDCEDPRVTEAFAQAARADPAAGSAPSPVEGAAWTEKILSACLDLHSEWGGDRTDLESWTMRAFLAGRLAAGDRWFAGILPQLEKAPNEAGVVAGDVYGDPTSRTAEALVILNEGWDGRPPR